jgi:hypothetical protein
MQGLLSNARGYSGTTLLGEATCCRCSIGETGIGHVGGKGRFSRPRAAGGTGRGRRPFKEKNGTGTWRMWDMCCMRLALIIPFDAIRCAHLTSSG